MLGIVASLLGSKVGRWLASGLLFSAVVAYVLWSVFQNGKKSAETARKIEQLEGIRERIKTDDQVRNMSADERRRELAKWVRD